MDKNDEFASISMQDNKFIYLLKYENKEVAKYLESAYDILKSHIFR